MHALARFSDELYLESLSDCVVLRTLNAAESAYAMVKFNKNFFSYFNYNYFSTDDNEGLKCKISMKSALNTFKSPNHMDKQVESLEIKLDPEACKLIFQLKCKHGIVKTHYVSILDCKTIHASYTKDLVPNRCVIFNINSMHLKQGIYVLSSKVFFALLDRLILEQDAIIYGVHPI